MPTEAFFKSNKTAFVVGAKLGFVKKIRIWNDISKFHISGRCSHVLEFFVQMGTERKALPNPPKRGEQDQT